MVTSRDLHWKGTHPLPTKKYQCGYCGENISSDRGYFAAADKDSSITVQEYIYVCHACHRPSYFSFRGAQTPGALGGNPVEHIPNPEVENLFIEAKKCFSVDAYTSAVSCCRKLLMNISVDQGAKEGESFVFYVEYLNSNGFIPPNGKDWVDEIKKHGNKANHKIVSKTKEDALLIIRFTEMLLRFVYEIPGMLGKK